ncbi:MAG: hypothetical protein ACYDAP_07580 [Thermoplasmataceae archaeon]
MSVSQDPLVPNTKVDKRSGPRSEEYKRKLKETWKNIKNDPVKYKLFRERLSQSVKQAWKNRENNGFGSRSSGPFSEETRKKMSETKRKQWRKIKEALKQYDDKGGSK